VQSFFSVPPPPLTQKNLSWRPWDFSLFYPSFDFIQLKEKGASPSLLFVFERDSPLAFCLGLMRKSLPSVSFLTGQVMIAPSCHRIRARGSSFFLLPPDQLTSWFFVPSASWSYTAAQNQSFSARMRVRNVPVGIFTI